ncbi:MAG: hypothetical protein AAGA44_03605 [Pseudomonadota bacterium]
MGTIFDILAKPKLGELKSRYDLIMAAAKDYSPSDRLDLLRLIKSEDQVVRGRGFEVLKNTGVRGFDLLDDAVRSASLGSHYDVEDLLDVMLNYSKKLNPDHLVAVLRFIPGESFLARIRIMHILALCKKAALREAIQKLGVGDGRGNHNEGLEILTGDLKTDLLTREYFATSGDVAKAYTGAALLLAAKRGIPLYVENIDSLDQDFNYIQSEFS